MAQPLRPKTLPLRVKANTRGVADERRKPNMPGPFIYVGTFVAEDDPGNDPPYTSWQSPPWQNSFFYSGTAYVAFRHGLDGQTDMIGAYDLTLGAVSGDVAFNMPTPFVAGMPPAASFPVELAPDVWSIAVQTCDFTPGVAYGDIRIFWPIVAQPIP